MRTLHIFRKTNILSVSEQIIQILFVYLNPQICDDAAGTQRDSKQTFVTMPQERKEAQSNRKERIEY